MPYYGPGFGPTLGAVSAQVAAVQATANTIDGKADIIIGMLGGPGAGGPHTAELYLERSDLVTGAGVDVNTVVIAQTAVDDTQFTVIRSWTFAIGFPATDVAYQLHWATEAAVGTGQTKWVLSGVAQTDGMPLAGVDGVDRADLTIAFTAGAPQDFESTGVARDMAIGAIPVGGTFYMVLVGKPANPGDGPVSCDLYNDSLIKPSY